MTKRNPCGDFLSCCGRGRSFMRMLGLLLIGIGILVSILSLSFRFWIVLLGLLIAAIGGLIFRIQ